MKDILRSIILMTNETRKHILLTYSFNFTLNKFFLNYISLNNKCLITFIQRVINPQSIKIKTITNFICLQTSIQHYNTLY